MTVYLYQNPTKSMAAKVCFEAAQILLNAGADVILSPDIKQQCLLPKVRFAAFDVAMEQADAVVSVGGDGTLLHMAKQCLSYEKPVLGINLGRTGFLATCETSEMSQKLVLLAKGQFCLDDRSLLETTIDGNSRKTKIALNDVVVYKGQRAQAVDYNIYCDDIQVDRYRGDGIIVATPTGSTAYSLSAGGPILDAHIRGIVVTPINAHALQTPAIVFSEDRCITIQMDASGRNQIYVSCDGGPEELLKDGSQVRVKLSEKSVKLITFNQADQFNAIGNKLRRR